MGQKYVNQKIVARISFVLLIVGLRLILQLYFLRAGFVAISEDETYRTIQAGLWAAHPRMIWADPGPWIPLERMLNGIAISVWRDWLLAPRATVFLASCLLMIYFSRWVWLLFKDKTILAASVAILATHRWIIWLSGTPALDMYYLSFLMLGIFYLTRWVDQLEAGRDSPGVKSPRSGV